MAKNETPTLESSRKVFSILENVIEAGGGGVTEIADATSLPKSTVHLHLQSLVETGQVVKREGTYHPSLQLFEWGERIRNDIEAYREGHEEIDSLAEETNELVNLGVIEDGRVRLVYLREIEEERTESSVPSISTEFKADAPKVTVLSEDYEHALGKELDVHATAMGKAMLAKMPKEEVESIIDRHGIPQHTENTITSRDCLFEELETIRSRGYAEDREERVNGLQCIGAAICRNDQPMAAISISGPTKQWNGEHKVDLADRVMNTANVIEIKLTHS